MTNNFRGINGLNRQQLVKLLALNNRQKGDETGETKMISKVRSAATNGAKFNYEELNKLFMEKGVNALLEELKNLRSSGAVESIKVNADSASGKTTITCEADGIEYTFVGAVGDNLKTEKSEEENPSSNTKTENTTTTTTTGNTTGTSTKTTGSITGNTTGTTGTTQTTGASGVSATETDPHYSQGYTIDELNEAFWKIYPYRDDCKHLWETMDEQAYKTGYQEIYNKFDNIVNERYIQQFNSCSQIFKCAFVEIDGKYYMRSDFSFDGKKYETIDDLRDLFLEMGMWKGPYYDYIGEFGDVGKYHYYAGKGFDAIPPIIITKETLDNCGYNFLPEEIDIYFDKMNNGQYILKNNFFKGTDFACKFLCFDDFISYLKGEHTAVIRREIGLIPLNLNNYYSVCDSNNGIYNEAEFKRDIDMFRSASNVFTSPYSKLNTELMGLGDITLESFFVKTQHGEYVLNQEKVKQFFPGENIKTVSQLVQAMRNLAGKINGGAIEVYNEITSDYTMKEAKLTEAEVKALGFTPVKTASEFQQILQTNPNAKICLMNDIDLSGVNWTPVGTESAPFTGSICGNGYTIKNLTVTSNSYYTGMFGVTDGANIVDLTIENAKVKNTNNDAMRSAKEENATGILVGFAKNSTLSVNIKNSSVEGRDTVGGVAGKVDGGTCSGDIGYPTTIKGGYDVGGVVGHVVNAKQISGRCGALVYGGKFLGGIAGFVDRCDSITGKIGLKEEEYYVEEEGKRDIYEIARMYKYDNEGVLIPSNFNYQSKYSNNGEVFELLNHDSNNIAWGALMGGKSSQVVCDGYFETTNNIDKKCNMMVGAVYDVDPTTGEMTPYTPERKTTESSPMDERVARLEKLVGSISWVFYREHYDTNIYPRRGPGDITEDWGYLLNENVWGVSQSLYNGKNVSNYTTEQVVADLLIKRLGEEFASKYCECEYINGHWATKYGQSMGCYEWILEAVCKEFAVDLFGKEIVDQCFTKDKDGNYILKPGAKLDGHKVDSLTFLAAYVQMDYGVEGAHAGCINNAEYVAKNCSVGDYQTLNPVTMGETCYIASDDYTSVFMVRVRTDWEEAFLRNVTSEAEIENWYVKETTVDEYGNEKIVFRKATVEDCHTINLGYLYHIVSGDMGKYEYHDNSVVYIDVKNIPPEISTGDTSIDVPIDKRFKAYTDYNGNFDSLRSDIMALKEQLKEKLSGYISADEFERVFERMLSYTIEYSSIPLPPNTPEDDKVEWLAQRTLERTVKSLVENLKNYKQIENSGYAAPVAESAKQNTNFDIDTSKMPENVKPLFNDLMQKMSGAVDYDVSSYLKQFTNDTIKYLVARYGYTESFAASVTDYIQHFVAEICGNSRDTVSQKYLEFISDMSFVDNCYGANLHSGEKVGNYDTLTSIQSVKGDDVWGIELGKKYYGKSTVPTFAGFLTYICEIDKNVGFECTEAQKTIILQKIFEKFSENFANSGKVPSQDFYSDLKNLISIGGWVGKLYDLNGDGRWIDEFCEFAQSVFAEIKATGITQSDVNVAKKVNPDVMLKDHPNGISAQDLVNEEFDFAWSNDPGTRKLMLSLTEQYRAYKAGNTAFSQEAILTSFIKLINDKLGIPNSDPPVLTKEAIEKLNNAGIDSISSLVNEPNFDYYYMSAYMPKTSQVKNDLYTGDVYNIDVQKDRIVLVTNTKTGEVYEIDLNKMVENLASERQKNMAYNVLLSTSAEVLVDMWFESTFYSNSIAGGDFRGGTEVHLNEFDARVMTHETGHAMANTALKDFDDSEEFQNAFNRCLQKLVLAGIRPYAKQGINYYFTANSAECFAEIYNMLMLGTTYNGSLDDDAIRTYFQECIELVKKYIKEIRNMDYDTRRK